MGQWIKTHTLIILCLPLIRICLNSSTDFIWMYEVQLMFTADAVEV